MTAPALPALAGWTKEPDLRRTYAYGLRLDKVRGLGADPRFARGEFSITPVFSGSGRPRGYALFAFDVGAPGRVEVEPPGAAWYKTPSAAVTAARAHLHAAWSKPNGRRGRAGRVAPVSGLCQGCTQPHPTVRHYAGPDKDLCASCYRFWRDVIGPPPEYAAEGPRDAPGPVERSWSAHAKPNDRAATRARHAAALAPVHAALARAVQARGYDNVPERTPLVPPTAFNLPAASAREVGLLGRLDTVDGPVVLLTVVLRARTDAAERAFAAHLVGRSVRYVLFFTADGRRWDVAALTADRTRAGLVPVLHRVPLSGDVDRAAVLDVLGWSAQAGDDPMDAIVESFDRLVGVKPNPGAPVPPLARWTKTSRAGAYPLDARVFSYALPRPDGPFPESRFDLHPVFARGRLQGWHLLTRGLHRRRGEWVYVAADGSAHTAPSDAALLPTADAAPEAARRFLAAHSPRSTPSRSSPRHA